MTKILDPVCDMIVELESARDSGLTLERPEREYAFCAQGCLLKFAKAPHMYVPKVEAWIAAGGAHTEPNTHAAGATPAIDEGMRHWYSACRCCLSETYPEVVEILDKEKAQTDA
jgi:YHS domain-containing protein